MSDYLIALVFCAFIGLGVAAPFVFSLGYVWVDTFLPQYVGRYVLGDFPVSAVMGVAALMGYVLADRKSPPRLGAPIVLMFAMAVWMTLTLNWSVAPENALVKWDWAFKTVCFGAFIPFVFRSRVQIEAMLLVTLLGTGMHLIPLGIKSAITGGGYKMNLTLLPATTGMSESSGLATVAMMFVPLLLFMRQNSVLVENRMARNLCCLTYAVLCFTAAMGTGARTGIVCMVVLGVLWWIQSRGKIVSGLAVLMFAALLLLFAPSAWKERMATIDSYQQETSALTRIKVWQWALEFSRDNPLGGGFRAYENNVIHMPPDALNPEGWTQRGRSTHSTWFEMLNEMGFPGLLMFLALIAITFRNLYRVHRRSGNVAELQWAGNLARALAMSLIVLMAGSTFIGIGFLPWFWNIFAIAFSLSEAVRRTLAVEKRGLSLENTRWLHAGGHAPAAHRTHA